MQHDYLAAYAACLARRPRARARARGALARASRSIAGATGSRRSPRCSTSSTGAAPAIVDPRSREQQHADLAAKQPAFEHRRRSRRRRRPAASTSRRSSCGSSRWTSSCCSRASRSCRATCRGSRSSSPATASSSRTPPAEHRVPWPAALRGKNVVVEAVGAGQRKAKIHYANDLATNRRAPVRPAPRAARVRPRGARRRPT